MFRHSVSHLQFNENDQNGAIYIYIYIYIGSYKYKNKMK